MKTKEMATQEQVQETPHLLQAQEALIAAPLKAQLQIERARAQTAEQERSALIQTLVTIRQDRAGGMVNSKGTGKIGSAGSGKRNKGQDHRNNVNCFSCCTTFHHGRDYRDNWSKDQERAKARAKATGKKDGWKENQSHIARKMKSMLMGGGRQQTIRHLGKQKNQ